MTQQSPTWQAVFNQANIADLVILTPFAVPFVADLYLGVWRYISELLTPERPLPTFNGDAMLFVNLAGVFAICLVLMRMQHGSETVARIAGVFKLFVVAIFAIALCRGASLIFVVPMLADAIVGLLLVVTTSRKR